MKSRRGGSRRLESQPCGSQRGGSQRGGSQRWQSQWPRVLGCVGLSQRSWGVVEIPTGSGAGPG